MLECKPQLPPRKWYVTSLKHVLSNESILSIAALVTSMVMCDHVSFKLSLSKNCLIKKNYTPEILHGTGKELPGKGDSFWKPSFSGSMLNFGGVKSFIEVLRAFWITFQTHNGPGYNNCPPPGGRNWQRLLATFICRGSLGSQAATRKLRQMGWHFHYTRFECRL